uniref:Uncharacterized protein n=1 Tax=Anguilla anguilla TaxID=7936 RepID=A0A0E9XBX9_ANGAN
MSPSALKLGPQKTPFCLFAAPSSKQNTVVSVEPTSSWNVRHNYNASAMKKSL